ncbi:hypothetical protein ACXR0O_02280 [Verrucomicrobiota bacterium sgz303538]
MALHLNLYHEVQKQQALQRRDPLKFAVWGLAAVALMLAGYYLLQLNSLRLLSNDLKGLESEFATLGPRAEAAKKRAAEAELTVKVGDTLVKRMEKRFYWAPVLADIVRVTPRDVQVVKMSGDVNGEDSKRCTLTIDGVAAAEDAGKARKVAEDFRRALEDQFRERDKGAKAIFRSLEDAAETATLNGKKLPTAVFAITLAMQVSEEPAPAAAAQTAKK